MVEAAVDQYRTPAAAKQITLHVSNDAPESIVSADEQALMQVLNNLVSNAVKYSPYGKQVFVRVLRNEGAVRIEVQDEGEGISTEDMKKTLWQIRPPHRTSHGRRTQHGTGLEYCQTHGGSDEWQSLVRVGSGQISCILR